MFNNGEIWVAPGLDQSGWSNLHASVFSRPNVGFPVALPSREMSAGGNCSNCGGAGRIIYVDPTDGTYKDIPCSNCSGSGQSSL